ncbi:ubiquitin-conjugating enzyme E2 22-like isoform X2 [Primulina eburnea]|uniref:ubiquitin-conjugating enzyme E2 22-like isoform X2 n=1 Tax=Primulina eburnea TaxID=1245227 RepID=UPI003C6C3CE1
MATNENLPPNVIKQLAKELKNLDETPPEGIKVGVNDDNFSVICADIEGPGYFLTKIFHPNIATNGEICVNALKKDWNPCLSLRHVLIVIRCLLIEPFPESALNEQAGKMLNENYDEYAKYARLYTTIHALKSKPKPKSIVSESTAMNMDQTNSSLNGVDQKNTAMETVTPSPLTPKPGNGQDLPSVITSSNETGVDESTAAPATQKKESGLNKVPADKKKEARKRSLKRL